MDDAVFVYSHEITTFLRPLRLKVILQEIAELFQVNTTTVCWQLLDNYVYCIPKVLLCK